MFFSFVIHCSCIPFVLMILGFNFHSHLHIYVFMIEFWDANMLMIMGFNFNVDLHMSDYMFWFWDSKLDVILGFNFVMFFGWNLLLFKLNVWFIKWYDGHGLVIRLIDYGHILIDACFLFFLSSWMYIMAMFYLGFACFFLLWPLLECSCNRLLGWWLFHDHAACFLLWPLLKKRKKVAKKRKESWFADKLIWMSANFFMYIMHIMWPMYIRHIMSKSHIESPISWKYGILNIRIIRFFRKKG